MRSVRRLSPFVCLAVVSALAASTPPALASPSGRLRRDPGPVASIHVRADGRGGAQGPGVHGVRATTYGTGRETWSTAARRMSMAAAPTVSMGFDAISRIGGNWPADPTGAMGNDWIFTAVNTSYALYDLTGTAVLGPASFRSFFTFPARTRVFDPKVVYDQYNQIFVMAFLAVNDAQRKSWLLLVAIPDATASDQATWCGTRIVADRLAGDGKQWADYPGLGYDLDRVVLTTNMFDFADPGGFAYAQILAFPKTGLYDCSQTLTFDTITGRSTRNPDRTQAFTIQPATSAGANPTTQYFLSFEPQPPAVVLWKLKDAVSGAQLGKVALPVGKVKIAPHGTQGGGGLGTSNTWWDPGDLRLVNAFYDADLNHVYAAHTVLRNLRPDIITGAYAEAAIRWYEVEPGSALADSKLTRMGVIGQAETDAGWPVAATDGSGNLFVTYSRASAVTGEFLSAWAAEIPPGATTGESVVLVPGQARMEALSGPERWGDFNAINRDPLDPTMVAMINQYAKSDGSGPTQDWQQVFDLVSGA